MRPMTLDFIRRSFRDVADKDYIAARILYRSDLAPQFLWAALQAVEKYIKAILLYNRVSTKGLSHDVKAGLARLGEIRDISFHIPREVSDFVSYLSEEGPNRYFEFPAVTHGDELLLLDRTVWHLRRYCSWLRGTITVHGRKVDLFPLELKRIQAAADYGAHRFKIIGGYLEDVLGRRGSPLREHLVWKNFYYGAKKKHVIKNFTKHVSFSKPAHYLDPTIFGELASLVDFSKPVRAIFRSLPVRVTAAHLVPASRAALHKGGRR